jgi:hypothetical protein
MATSQRQVRSADELAEAVYQCISSEHDALDAFKKALPEHQAGYRTLHELDFADFALTVGIAYGIARGEDPYESAESVTTRAAAAATTVWERVSDRDVTYEQDPAARPVPTIYPGVIRAGQSVPWEPIEDVANACKKIVDLVSEEDRRRAAQIQDELGHMALRVMAHHREQGAGGEEA